jgi:hypothetical protein
MKITFWAPCGLVEADQHFRGVYCLHHQGNVVKLWSTSARTWHYIADDYHLQLNLQFSKTNLLITGNVDDITHTGFTFIFCNLLE